MGPVTPDRHRAAQLFCGCRDSAGSQIKTGILARVQADFSGLREWGKGSRDSIPRLVKSSPPAAQPESDNGHLASDKKFLARECLPSLSASPKQQAGARWPQKVFQSKKQRGAPDPLTHPDAGRAARRTGAEAQHPDLPPPARAAGNRSAFPCCAWRVAGDSHPARPPTVRRRSRTRPVLPLV